MTCLDSLPDHAGSANAEI